MKKTIFMITLAGILAVVLSRPVMAAVTYSIDSGHSTIGFAVKHLSVGTTRGSFDSYDGEIKFNAENLEEFSADVTIEASSINTKLEGRDKHLRSADFLDVENHPAITFKNAKLEKRGEGKVIVGELTLKGVTKTVTIPVTVSGPVTGPKGGQVIGIAGQTIINRQDYGVSWSKNLDSGGLVVDDNVTLIVELEGQEKS